MAAPIRFWGTVQVVDPGPDAAPVLAHRSDVDGVTIVALHNFADQDVTGLQWTVEPGATNKGKVLTRRGEPIEGHGG